MCGINGFNFKDQNLILEMNRLTAHRGPDQTDFWCGEELTLGHDRLSIIDLSVRGKQPMWDAAKELAVVFNGEIYNFKDLRDELKREFQFRTETDTEVILYAYRKWGIDCLKKFNGIFALALWDMRSRELFLARDVAGVKPLYYYYDGTKLIFSSEIKAILAHDIPRMVDKEAFNLYFQLLYIPEPRTMFFGIKKLPAAGWLRLKDKKITIEKYWSVKDHSNLNDYAAARDEITEIFRDSVKRQLISDRPVGIFLSGGVDSTAVLGAASEFHAGKIKTFSVGFKDSTDEKKFNADFELARQTARHFGTEHRELLIGPGDMAACLKDIVWHLDEPNFNPTAAAIFLLSREAKKEVAVILGGDGGDELFGGYPRYYFSRLISLYQSLPALFQNCEKGIAGKLFGRPDIADKLSLPADEKRVVAFLAQKHKLLYRVLRSDIYTPDFAANYLAERYFKNRPGWGKDFEKGFMQIDREGWLMDESLARTDKMTMAFGLEERVPILDKRLLEISGRLPTRWKLNPWQRPGNFQGKKIWREAVGRYLPAHIRNEKKRGWFTPAAKWIRTDLKETVEQVISPENLNSDFFDVKEVRTMWQDHLSGNRYNLNFIWAIVMWQMWYNRFIKK